MDQAHSSDVAPASPHALSIRLVCDRAINYAFQQNSIPLVRELRILNSGPTEQRDLFVRLTTEPAFAFPTEIRIQAIPAHGEFQLDPVELHLSPDFLAQLTEKMTALVHVDVTGAGTSTPPLRHTEPVTLLAPSEWCGLTALPEILAAFVLPNDPAVMRILATAAEILREHTGRAALNGYQDKSRERAWQQLAAIYQAIARERIRYINPPASFEETGQKVRFPSEILAHRFATCLDLALLVSACCEQAGLHPLVLMHHGHAYAGCWLVERTLPDSSTDDQQAIRKLVELEELSAFELTALTSETPGTLESAELLAAPHLQPGVAFRLALDVKRARIARILPLPIAGHSPKPVDSTVPLGISPAAPHALGGRSFVEPSTADPASIAPTPASRIDLWKSRLLDLSLRNRLLNFRLTKGTVQILSAAPEHVEDELAANVELKLAPRPAVMARQDPRDAAAYTRAQNADALTQHLHEELKQGRLHTALGEPEHQQRLTELYRAARLGLEENGTNTLFAAVGVLEWCETEHSDRPLRAPLLLVPVELKRKSVVEGFYLRRIDEEARLNVTLIEMLRQQFRKEIAGLDPLPEDENGVDVAVVFRLVREAVRDMPGWEVKSEIWLGQFSFTKFLLWKDLTDRLDALTRNRVVRHLVQDGGGAFPNPPADVQPSDLDDRFTPSEIFCPRSADSSQLAAVLAAAAGHDFVLEGPPGTGKSQTITNIIAHCLAHGKRVLFVAEKRAALDVVHRRLKEEGLAPFCLELHSNKTGKGEVLAQFRDSLALAASHAPAEWAHQAIELQFYRDSLNAYVRALHRPYSCGLSAHLCLDYLLPRQNEPIVKLDWPDFLTCESRRVDTTREATRQLAQRAELLTDISTHPLAPLHHTEWSPAWADRVRTLLASLGAHVTAVENSTRDLRTWLNRPTAAASRAELSTLRDLAGALLAPHAVGGAFLTTPWPQLARDLDTWIPLARERRTLRSKLASYDETPLTALALDALQQQWNAAQSSWFLVKWIRLGGIRRQLRTAHRDHANPAAGTIPDTLGQALRLREINQSFASAASTASPRLGALWANGNPDPDTLTNARAWGETLHASINALAGDDPAALHALQQHFAALFTAGPATSAPGTVIGTQLTAFVRDWDAFTVALGELTAAAALQPTAIDSGPDHLTAAAQLIAQLESGWRYLRPWCSWQKSLAAAAKVGLTSLCLAIEQGTAPAADAPHLFERSFRRGLLDAILGSDETLRVFFGHEHQGSIARFRELDERVAQLTRDVIRARLAAKIPRDQPEDDLPKAELGLLRKEIGKKTRHLPVRQLLSRIPTLLPRLKPCVLMSPLSVAQYLDATHEHFDVVVFDEASQIPVWDAVGAIARGQQLIVVGDPKQLPPTNFFNRTEEAGDEESLVEFEDLESILDELLSNGLRHKRLQWHYRSRHEGLIAFSNRHYYENDLLTFPSPEVKHSGVHLRLVAAHYDKGKTRTNRREAEELVTELVRRLRDPVLSRRSFGVVTFSLAQQQLVENLLDEQRRLHPEIEAHFGDSPPIEGEPVFVKNLENVQGDERDVILFSICYGPDETGRISMNFGPLNRDGGERRLNVAVTRAKHEVLVFSSLRGDQIDLTRTRARGVHDLKHFLEYAARGLLAAVASAAAPAAGVLGSEFERAIERQLRQLGHDVHRQIGCSDYRIDLAIVDPASPGRYLLGIECDGQTYRHAATARDRDKLRQLVLEGLGWKLHRVWSTDWWHDPEGEMTRLTTAIESARAGPVATG